MDIETILRRIRKGDQPAFALLIRHFQQPLFGYLGRMGLAQSVAEDIAQETFLRVWQRLNDYDPARAEFSTWLFTIARNLTLHELERAANKHEVVGGDSLQDLAAEESLSAVVFDQTQQRQRLYDALLTLTLEECSALALAYFRALDSAAIARIEGCSVGAVKVRQHRARQRLRKLLESDDE